MLLLTQLSLLFTLTCALPATITNQSKFTTLRKIILADIINSPQNLREYARASFHDLANYDPVSKTAGPHGCIGSKTAGQTQNKDVCIF